MRLNLLMTHVQNIVAKIFFRVDGDRTCFACRWIWFYNTGPSKSWWKDHITCKWVECHRGQNLEGMGGEDIGWTPVLGKSVSHSFCIVATRIKVQRGSRYSEDQGATRIRMQRGSGCNEDQDATRIKIQRGSGCNEDQDTARIKIQRVQRGSGCNEDQDTTRIKVQWGSRCNEDQDTTRIKMQQG